MKKFILAAALVLTEQAHAKPAKSESIGGVLATRFVGGIEKYIANVEDAERAAVEVAKGNITLKIFEKPDCDPNSGECEGPAEVAYAVTWPVFEVSRYKCGPRNYGVRYEAETPHNVFTEYYERITVIDSSSCPKSDRGIGYVTLTVEGAKGPASMQFFIDKIYRTKP